MTSRPLPKKIILGTAQLGLDYGLTNHDKIYRNQDACFELLQMAWNNGVICLDSAFTYGGAHSLISSYAKSHSGLPFTLHTKIKDIHEIEKNVEDLATQLGTGNLIDVLYFHDTEIINETTLGFFKNLKRKNVIKRIGISFYTVDQIARFTNNPDIDVFQFPLNLLDHWERKKQALTEAHHNGKELIVRSLFLQGLLLAPVVTLPEKLQLLKAPLMALEQISTHHGIPIHELCFRYAFSFNEISAVIIGVDSVEQLLENLKHYSIQPLPEPVLCEIHAIQGSDLLIDPRNWTARK